jgi:hypothetical protein
MAKKDKDKLIEHKIKCPKGYLPRCTKIKKKGPSRKKLLKLIKALPADEQKRLQKINQNLEVDKQRQIKLQKEIKKDEQKAVDLIDTSDLKKVRDALANTPAIPRGEAFDGFRVKRGRKKRKLRQEGEERKDDDDSDDDQAGGNTGRGLYDSEITEIMKDDPTFSGVIAANEIGSLPVKPKASFILNLDPRSKPGSHWVCCKIDSKFDKSIMYYDPFGDQPSPLFMKDIKTYIDKLKLPYMLKMKINNVKNQDINSDNCGFHCINFLQKIRKGETFKQATGFKDQDNSVEMEKEANALAKQKGFGYV